MIRLIVAVALLACLDTALAAGGSTTPTSRAARRETYDVVVYGGTSGGVAAAVQAARMGKSVVLVEPSRHLGGLTSGGLGATDIGNKAAIGGIAREFYQRVLRHYQKPDSWKCDNLEEYRKKQKRTPDPDAMWTFEPHVAEQIYRDMVAEHKIPVVLGERLDLAKGVKKDGERITAIVMESGRTFSGRMFIDATYEGDLMAKAGVSYAVGREANAQYGETLNGVQTAQATKHQFEMPVDPYVVPGDPNSGLVPRIHAGSPGKDGEADRRVQAYCFRMCTTDEPENRVPFPKPEGYDPQQYELLARYLQTGWDQVFGNHQLMPNRKTDTNNHGAFSTDDIGMNYDYPEGDYATRERIVREHETYQKGLMWFLANDPRVPEKLRSEVGRWGLAKDEFADNGHWPHQLYVREARRMVGDYVMTEQHCVGRSIAEDSAGLAAYGMDSHNTQRYVDASGHARNEGDVEVGGFSPYPISYRALVPKAGQCENLLVPVCLSASHIAYGSIRMEPVFMVLGQSAATAAVQAIDEGKPVQGISYSRLRARLLADKQVLDWTGPKRSPRVVIDPAKLPGIVVDDNQAKLTGQWTRAATIAPFVGRDYLHDGRSGQGSKSARFEVKLPRAGRYEVRMSYSPSNNRATNVPVTVYHAGGPTKVTVNERKAPAVDELFVSLGVYSLAPGQPAAVEISNAGADGYVVVDAVQFVPVE